MKITRVPRGRIAVSPIDYREAQVLMRRIARPVSTEDFNDAWSALVDAFLHYERLVKALEREDVQS